MIKARKRARKNQADIAKHMQTSQAMVARIESGLGQKKHSPTLNTLRKYANAVGCKIVIDFVPKSREI